MNIAHFAYTWQHSASTVMTDRNYQYMHVSTNLHSKISCYFYYFFWKNSYSWNSVGQDQEF